MGFFKKAKRKIKKAVKKVVSVAPRVIAGVATGGLTEVSRATGIAPGLPDLAQAILAPTRPSDLVTSLSVFQNPGGAVAQILTGAETLDAGGGSPVAGNFLGGLAGVLGTTSGFGGSVGTLSQIGSGFLSGFLPAQGPVAGRGFGDSNQQFSPTPTMSGGVRAIATAGASMAASVLAKMSAMAGKNITLRAAMIVIRRLAKLLGSPTAVALALGISLGELQTILTENALKGSSGRRMNAGNVKALRRAHRRINSFHKLCGENDRLRSPRRRSTRKSPTTVVCK